MRKFSYLLVVSIFIPLLLIYSIAWGLDAPAITEMAKGPNQINLTWPADSNPGWGYIVEIHSDSDSRYSSWTEIAGTRNGRQWLPYWVTESHYLDVADGSGTENGSAAQWMQYGLQHNTTYNFRVRTFGKQDDGTTVYSAYSNTAQATTTYPSTIRYVTVTGAGSKDGTSWDNAWDHISDANNVSAGTLVLVGGGNYTSDNLTPSNSGTQANRIVFQAKPGDTVTITSTTENNTILLGTNYVVVDGINVDNSDGDYRVYITGSRNALVNCEIDGAGSSWDTVNTSGDYNLIHYCYIHDSGTSGADDGYACTQNAADRNIVQYTNISRGGHDTGLTQNGSDYNKWLNNLHDGGWGLGWECTGSPASQYNLVEGSVIKDVLANYTTSNTSDKPGIELSSNYNTIRRNSIYDGISSSYPNTRYSPGVEISQQLGTAASNNLVYNNTIYHNSGPAITMFDSNQRNNTIKNNIIYYNSDPVPSDGDGPLDRTIFLAENYAGTTITNNLILFKNWSTLVEDPNHAICVKGWGGTAKSVADADTDWVEFSSNYSFTPNFIDEAIREFHLQSTSQAIDAGVQVPDSTWGTLGYDGLAPDIGAFEVDAPAPPTNLRIL